jgi:hypothetical protein
MTGRPKNCWFCGSKNLHYIALDSRRGVCLNCGARGLIMIETSSWSRWIDPWEGNPDLEAENKRLREELSRFESADSIITLQAANDELAMKNRLTEYENKHLKDKIIQLVGSLPIVTIILGGECFIMPEVSANAVIKEFERLLECSDNLRETIRDVRHVLKNLAVANNLEDAVIARKMLKEALK